MLTAEKGNFIKGVNPISIRLDIRLKHFNEMEKRHQLNISKFPNATIFCDHIIHSHIHAPLT